MHGALNRWENWEQMDEITYCFWLHHKQGELNRIHVLTDTRIHIHNYVTIANSQLAI